MNRLLLALTVCLFASPAFAQTPVPVSTTSKLTWDIAGPDAADAAGSLTAVRGYNYKRYTDTSTTGLVIIGVTCVPATAANTFTCTATMPASTLGQHTMAVTASATFPAPVGTVESLKSNQLAFVFFVAPAVPALFRLAP